MYFVSIQMVKKNILKKSGVSGLFNPNESSNPAKKAVVFYECVAIFFAGIKLIVSLYFVELHKQFRHFECANFINIIVRKKCA